MNKLKTLLIFILSGLCLIVNVQSQNIDPSYFSTTNFLQGTSNIIPASSMVTLSSIDKQRNSSLRLREKNTSARLYIKLDFGNDYVNAGGAFGIKIQVEIKSNGNALTNIPQAELVIDERNPEALTVVDLMPVITSLSTNLTVHVISITDIAGNPLSFPAGLLKNYIDNNLHLSATFERKYSVDVRTEQGGAVNMSNAPFVSIVGIVNRLVTFNWQPNTVDAYPNYELQILKLNNTNIDNQNDPNEITAILDWSNALKVETQSYNKNIPLTMAEGTGFYIWRVRPIGTYFDGGIANSENYGEWSYSLTNNTSVTMNKNDLTAPINPTPYAFYFTDPDENINWIYSRAFAEGDNENQANATGTKVSEGMNYADGLLRARQSQAFNSSNSTTIVSQTVSDYSGRPALTTLPVPLDGGLTGYKVGFVKTNTGSLYTAADYDNDQLDYNSDLKDNTEDPSTIKDNGTDFSYYSNNSVTLNSNANNNNVPNAEGYAFKRTKFKTDGTGRVDEESGVGKVHSLGSQNDGHGRTTRVLFGTPSDDELIRIFGDEAPLSESVIKTITIDPNNVVSVSYTSKEGKTVATALISENSDNLVNLQKAATSLTVTNTADQNIVSNGKFTSSKRIVAPSDNFDIILSYNLGTFPTPCGGGCSFNVKFYLVDLKRNVTYISDSDPVSLGVQGFVASGGAFVFPSDWEFKATNGSSPIVPTIPSGSSEKKKITLLKEGEYLFIKEVYSSKSAEDIEAAGNTYSNTYQPILNAIAVKMQATQTQAGQAQITTFYQTLEQLIATYQATPNATNSTAIVAHLEMTEDVPVDYMFPLDFSLTYTPDATPGATNDNIGISIANGAGAGCASCPSVNVAVPKPEICYACDGTMDAIDLTDMKNSNDAALPTEELKYGINDIRNHSGFMSLTDDQQKRDHVDAIAERYFIKLFKVKLLEEGLVQDLNNTIEIDAALNTIAPGFTMEGIKFMISNMLISKYYTGNALENSGWYEATIDAGTGNLVSTGTLVSALSLDFNYTCEDLLKCWTKSVNLLASFGVDEDVNAVAAFNDQDGGNSAQNNADDEDNWEEMSKRQKRKLKKKLGQELEDFSNSDDGNVPKAKIEALTNLISNFMDCATYQFAAIIDGGTLPGYIVSTNNIPNDYDDYDVPNANPRPSTVDILAPAPVISGVTYNGVPVLPGITNTCGTISSKELTYSYTLKPEWMFKYFIYNAYSNTTFISTDDNSGLLLPHQVQVELKSCYDNMSSYISIVNSNGGNQIPSGAQICNSDCGNFNHLNWSKDQRLTFYKEASGSPKCFENKGITAPYEEALPLCADGGPADTKVELIQAANSELNNYLSACSDKGNEIKSALLNSLTDACYKIVDCKTGLSGHEWEITEKEVDLMVKAVIDKCIADIETIQAKLPTIDNNSTPNDKCDDVCQSGTITSDYGCNLGTEFPKYTEVVCYVILLNKADNSLFAEESKKINIVLFADCDKVILDFLSQGYFLPHITACVNPAPNCTADINPKEWLPPATGFAPNACTNANEWTNPQGSPAPNFSTYSEVETVIATGQ